MGPALVVLVAAAHGCGAGVGAKSDGSPVGAGDTAGDAGPAESGPSTPDASVDTSSGGAGASADALTGAPADAAPVSVDAPPEASAGEVPSACAPCTDYAPAAESGRVTAAALDQLSGVAASRRNPGVLFVHNDHSTPEFWALGQDGALRASFTYSGATVRDVEDIAVAACPSGTCVFLADIGGNLAARPDYTIARVPEPVVALGGAPTSVALAADRLVFTYPDAAQHNAESLMIDPRSGTLYVIDKVAAGAHSTVYRLAATFGGATVIATKVVELPVPMSGDQPATAADAHPCGTGFILRTYNTAYEFRIAATAPFEDAFRAPPVAVPVAQERQGEGIAYQPDGRGFFTNSEGAMQPINHTGCR
jgi:hypothetical protein